MRHCPHPTPPCPGAPPAPPFRPGAGGGFSATLCNQAGGAGAGTGLPGSGAGRRRGVGRGSELARSLRDVWALSPLPLHRTRLGRVVRRRAPDSERCGGRVQPGLAWLVPGSGRAGAAPRPGGWAAGEGRVEVPSPPPTPFPSLPPPRSLEEVVSVRVPCYVFFSPLHYSTTLGNPNPRAHRLSGTPFSAFPGAPSHLLPPLPPLPKTPHHLGSKSRKTRPFSPIYSESAPPSPRLSRPPSQRPFSPPPRTPASYWAAARPLSSSKGADCCQLGPHPAAPSRLGVLASRMAALSCSGLREQVRTAAAWCAPARSPVEGRAGARGGPRGSRARTARSSPRHSLPPPLRGVLPRTPAPSSLGSPSCLFWGRFCADSFLC